MIEIDFSKRHSFPGTTGNSFDNLLHAFILIERIPLPIYVFFLLILSFLPRPTDFYMVTIRWLFSLIDLALLAGLPLSGKSFGPAKPPVLILSVFRTLISLFPLFISLPLQVIGTLLVIYGFWIEPHCIGVTKQTFQSKKISPGKIIRILHIGDLHVERITKREQQLNQLIRNLNPDLILFSGDFLNLSYRKDPIAIEAVRSLIMEWHARYGTFGVTGSPAVDLPEVIPNLIEGLPLVLLNDQIQSLSIDGQEINIIGLTCSHKPFIDGPQLKTLLSKPISGFSILLYHSPDLSPIAAQTGVDLQLSGHTHGGQVRIPLWGAIVTGSLYGKRFEMGLKHVGDMTLYITRGIGMEGAGAPRVRFLCPPEIILWEISGK